MKTVKYPADRKSNVNFIIFKLNPLMPMSPISKRNIKWMLGLWNRYVNKTTRDNKEEI